MTLFRIFAWKLAPLCSLVLSSTSCDSEKENNVTKINTYARSIGCGPKDSKKFIAKLNEGKLQTLTCLATSDKLISDCSFDDEFKKFNVRVNGAWTKVQRTA